MNKLAVTGIVILVITVGVLSYLFIAARQELRKQEVRTQSLSSEIETLRIQKGNIENSYKVEIKNSIERAIKIESMEEVIDNYYSSIKESFSDRYFTLYVEKCKEKEAEVRSAPSPLLDGFMCT